MLLAESEFMDGSLKTEMSTKEKPCIQSLHTYHTEGIEIKVTPGHRVIETPLNSKPIGSS